MPGMPVTRTISHQQAHRNGSSLSVPTSTLESSTRSSLNKRKKDTAPKSKPVVLGEIIEISSDEDEPAPQINSAIMDLRRQVKKLKEVNVQCTADLAGAKDEISELRASSGSGKGKVVLDLFQLEDDINCEICTARMWSPFILPGCGHTFCLSCLQDWFSTTLAQFMATHPDYNDVPNQNLREFEALAQNPAILRANPHLIAYYAELQRRHRPEYTCPTCREQVRNRPVEDFALKSLIRTIALATGESSPRKAEKPSGGKATAPRAGPWDGFFPRA